MWDFWDGLGGYASDLGLASTIEAILAFLGWLVQTLIVIFHYIFALIQAVFNFFITLGQKIASFFETLWTGFFKKIFNGFVSAVLKVHDWLESKLAPILDFLKQARAYFDRIFNAYIKPILNLMQDVRKFLSVLRFFGIKWAAQLDAAIAQIQADIASAFLQVRGILNGFIDIVNAISDPLGLLRRPTIVLSVRRTFNAMVHVLTRRPVGFFFPSPRKNAVPGIGQLPANFLPSDTTYNPPASSFFSGDDGLGGYNGFAPATVPPDTSVDDTDPLDYFNNDLYPPPPCDDTASCLARLLIQAAQTPITVNAS